METSLLEEAWHRQHLVSNLIGSPVYGDCAETVPFTWEQGSFQSNRFSSVWRQAELKTVIKLHEGVSNLIGSPVYGDQTTWSLT